MKLRMSEAKQMLNENNTCLKYKYLYSNNCKEHFVLTINNIEFIN